MKKRIFVTGGDYNPEQWIDYDGIWDEDIRLMKKAKINCVSLGIFSWSMIEKEEGIFDFSWMDEIIDKLYSNGIYVILATPSGARPPWLAQKYPEVLRTDEDRRKRLFGRRHNHCITSPIYRKKTSIIDEKLSERYGEHPAVIMWHISNELSSECHCEHCQKKFREWLMSKYDNDINKLNHAWWNTFWSHRYTDWEQIQSPSLLGENTTHGQRLDWNRFVSDTTVSFINNEVNAIRKHSNLPVTTNFMDCEGLDYFKMAEAIDVITWDSYPSWHNNNESVFDTAMWTGFQHDLYGIKHEKL